MPDQVGERWLWVPGYEDRYEISDRGRVRSWVPWNGHELPRIMQPIEDDGRYTQLDLRDADGKRRRIIVHQTVLTAFVSPRPEGMQAAHEDDNKRNNRLSNLAWKTRLENMKDRSRNGRTAVGERNGSYKHGLYVGPNRKKGVPGAPRKHYIAKNCSRGHELPAFQPGKRRRCFHPDCREARKYNAVGGKPGA